MAAHTPEELTRRLAALEDIRRPWMDAWADIAEYVLPGRGRFAADGQGPSPRGEKIIDATATRALGLLASGLQGGLTSPSRPWFRLGLEDPGLAETRGAGQWLQETERRLYQALARSNFYSAVHALYLEQAGFGTGCLHLEADPDTRLRFRLFTAGEYSLGADHLGRVDTVFRRCRMSAANLAQAFGQERLTPGQREAADRDPDRVVDLVHAVLPNPDHDPDSRDAARMPYASLHFQEGGQRLLGASGYLEFPVMAPRWEACADRIYGRGPGFDILGDVKMLQEMNRSQIKAVHKVIDPPMRIPAGYKDRLSLLPGAENFVDAANPEAVGPLYQIRPDIASAEMKIQNVQAAIRQGLFNDLFLAVNRHPSMTATEVLRRHEEKMLMLGPVIERQTHELLDPLIGRAYAILARAGQLPEPPRAIQGRDLKVEYVSMLAQAQKMAGVESIRHTAGFVSEVAAVDAGVLDKFDADAAVDEYARLMGAPDAVVRGAEEVSRIRLEREAARARQQEADRLGGALKAGAEAARTLSQADTDGDNALTRLLGETPGKES
jgi:hypothetical protein